MPSEMLKKEESFIEYLTEKYPEKYSKDELVNCYCETKDRKGRTLYIACFNENGDCYVEEFRNLPAVYLYLYTTLDLDEVRHVEHMVECAKIKVDIARDIKERKLIKNAKCNDVKRTKRKDR